MGVLTPCRGDSLPKRREEKEGGREKERPRLEGFLYLFLNTAPTCLGVTSPWREHSVRPHVRFTVIPKIHARGAQRRRLHRNRHMPGDAVMVSGTDPHGAFLCWEHVTRHGILWGTTTEGPGCTPTKWLSDASLQFLRGPCGFQLAVHHRAEGNSRGLSPVLPRKGKPVTSSP